MLVGGGGLVNSSKITRLQFYFKKYYLKAALWVIKMMIFKINYWIIFEREVMGDVTLLKAENFDRILCIN